MTRRNPLCAWCGKPFKRNDARMIVEIGPSFPGRPSYGWHISDSDDCTTNDPEWKVSVAKVDSLVRIKRLVAVIEARGPGRVIWLKK